MKPKQIFRTYEAGAKVPDTRRFCIRCGEEYPSEAGDAPGAVCGKCGHVHYRNPAPAVSVLVNDSGRVLLCRRRAGRFQGGEWCLPCGYIEYHEDYLAAAVREVKEETGVDVRIKAIVSVCSNFFTPDLHTLVVVLLAEPVGGTALSPGDDENDALQWFTVADGLPDMAFEADDHIIKRYFATRLEGAPVEGRG